MIAADCQLEVEDATKKKLPTNYIRKEVNDIIAGKIFFT